MLDVHSPHNTTHTWTDFFIHVATICVGLLIAIGLEQTVEAVHHHYERKAILEEMRAEAERNRTILETNSANVEQGRVWARQTIGLLRSTQADHGVVTLVLPQGTATLDGNPPSRAVWDIAKSNGEAALVPEGFAEIYDRQAWEADNHAGAVREAMRVESDFNRMSARLQTPIAPGATLHLSAAESETMLNLLGDEVAAATDLQYWGASWLGVADSIVSGTESRSEVDAAILRRHASYHR